MKKGRFGCFPIWMHPFLSSSVKSDAVRLGFGVTRIIMQMRRQQVLGARLVAVCFIRFNRIDLLHLMAEYYGSE